MTNDYTSSTDAFADISDGSYTTSDYPVMSSFVTVASRAIDGEFGRWPGFFYPSTDEVTNYYNGSGCDEQDIDEFVSISVVAVAEQGGLSSTDYTVWVLNTDYITTPYNAANKLKPITGLEIVSFNGVKAAFYSGQKSVKITGIAGYSTTPPDLVVQACKAQAVQWFMKAKMGWQNNNSGEANAPLDYALDDNIRAMLTPLLLELSK